MVIAELRLEASSSFYSDVIAVTSSALKFWDGKLVIPPHLNVWITHTEKYFR